MLGGEYQNINRLRRALSGRPAQPPAELTVVGDDDQSIYQWRGADVRNILTFRARRPQSARFTLADNRRSRPGVIHAASAFALPIPDRLDKSMEPTRPAAEPSVVCWQAETDIEEAERLADVISRLHGQGFSYRDVAVLFRSVRTSAPPLIEALRSRGIPLPLSRTNWPGCVPGLILRVTQPLIVGTSTCPPSTAVYRSMVTSR